MRINLEKNRIDRFRIVLGAVMAAIGVVVVAVEAAVFGFSNLFLSVIGAGILLAGIAIASSPRLAEVVSDFLHFG